MITNLKYKTTIRDFRNRIFWLRWGLSESQRKNHTRILQYIRKLLWLNAEINEDFLLKSEKYRKMTTGELRNSDVLNCEWYKTQSND